MLATIDRNIGRDADDGAGPEHTASVSVADLEKFAKWDDLNTAAVDEIGDVYGLLYRLSKLADAVGDIDWIQNQYAATPDVSDLGEILKRKDAATRYAIALASVLGNIGKDAMPKLMKKFAAEVDEAKNAQIEEALNGRR